MTLLNPAWLLLLLLLVPIVLLHMRRRRPLVVGSVQIWRKVTTRAAAQRSRKLPPFTWPLFLQLLAVVLLSLALSRPVITSGASQVDHLIVVLDNSIAMAATGEPAEAAEALQELLDSAGQDHISVVLTSSARPVQLARVDMERAPDWQDLLPEGASFAAADWQAVERSVRGLTLDDERTAVLALTAPASAAPTTLGGMEVETRQFAKAEPGPWLQETRVVRSDDGLELRGLVHPADPDAENIELELSFRAVGDTDYLDWGQHSLASADLDATGDGLLEFSILVQLPLTGVLRVKLAETETGPLTSTDNFVQVQPVQARVLLLGNNSPQVVRALASVDGVVLYQADGLDQVPLDGFDLVVTAGIDPQLEPQTSTLVIAPAAADPLLAPLDMHWLSDHELSDGVNWGALEIESAARVPLLPGASAIVTGNGLPLVQARTVQGGRQVVLAFDPVSSNWPELTGFPTFIGNVLDWVLPGIAGGGSVACQPGLACPLPAAYLAAGTRLVSETGTELEAVQVGNTVLDRVIAEEPGVYWPMRDGVALDGAPLVVNAAAVPHGTGLDSAGSGATVTRTELWRPLVIILVVALLLEAIIYYMGLRGRSARGQARRRMIQGIVLRGVTIVLAGIAVANLLLPFPRNFEQVVLIVGGSPDEPALAQLLDQAGDVANRARNGRSLAVVDYDDNPHLIDSSSALETTSASADLQRGLDLALATLSPNAPGRVLLASNGMQTSGDIRGLLPELQARHVSLDVLALPAAPAGEIQVQGVTVPAATFAGDRFTLRAHVVAAEASDVTLVFKRDGEVIDTRSQTLQAGPNTIELLVTEEEAGEFLYEVEVQSSEDSVPENNFGGAYVEVLPAGRILLIARQTAWGESFADALRLQGLDVTVVLPDDAPDSLDEWLQYQGVAMMDVPSIDLFVSQQEQLEQAVSEYGRGLLLLGGPNTFGPGGYYETIFEDMSPLSSRVPRDAPNVALVFVLDRSGSMEQLVDGDTNRLDIARQATITAAGLLHEESRVSIVVFDSEANVLLPLQDKLDLDEIEAALELLVPGGGTYIFPGAEQAYLQLQDVDAGARHVIIMSDGLSHPGGIVELLETMSEEGITVSVVAIGQGADEKNMQRYADAGGGAFHATIDFRALPSILSQESMMLSGSLLDEHPTQPIWLDRNQPFVQGLPTNLPAINGFVLTTPKDEATIHLQVQDAEGEDFPLLASWRYGNGHVLAFTSQVAGSWTADWLRMPEYPLFWSQALRNFLPAAGQQGINLQVTQRGSDLHLVAEVLDDREEPIAGQSVQVNGLQLTETREGRYEGTIPDVAPGTIELVATAGEQELHRRHFVPYPASLDFSRADLGALENLAVASGGRVLSGDEPLFVGGQRVSVAVSVWPWLLVAALILFLFELVNRYDPALLRKEAR